MGALAALGIALGVLFGVFLLVLAAEILYMAWWSKQRKKARDNKPTAWCWNGLSDPEAPNKEAVALDVGPAYYHEAALVGSFGGYATFSPVHMLFAAAEGGGRFLFSIAEETKEDLTPAEHHGPKDAPADGGPRKGCSCESLPSFSNSGATSLSTSTARSSSASCCSSAGNSSLPATPFATPPSSPPASPSPSSSFSTATSRFSSPPSDAP